MKSKSLPQVMFDWPESRVDGDRVVRMYILRTHVHILLGGVYSGMQVLMGSLLFVGTFYRGVHVAYAMIRLLDSLRMAFTYK